MTARELLALMANLAGVPDAELPARVEAAAARLAIEAGLDQRIGELPAPVRGRLGIAQALVGEPEILLLDEPFQWLDPEGRLAARTLLRELAGRTTVVLASHRLADVEGLCDQIAVVEAGRLVIAGPTGTVLAMHAPPVYVLDLAARDGVALDGLVLRLLGESWVREAAVVDGTLRVAVTDEELASSELLPAVVGAGVGIEGVRRARPSLDTVLAGLRRDVRPEPIEIAESSESGGAGESGGADGSGESGQSAGADASGESEGSIP
jgi:ABC-2 type transport system ATP-binding protein